MHATDFEYDNQYLSDFKFIICDFDSSSGMTIANSGSKISFEKVPRNNGKTNSLVGTKYADCIKATFDICKDPDYFDPDEMQITHDEYRDIVRWLNRREFLKFRLMDDEADYSDICYYNSSFNVEKIEIASKLYGIRLTMETDCPFGYGVTKTIKLNFTTQPPTPQEFIDTSDEIGYIYPDMIITCKEAGDLSISNKLLGCTMIIKNCSAGEVITIKGSEQIILTSYNSHNICNDFNYQFFQIGNTYYDNVNQISVSKLCDIVITYSPYIKDTL